MPHPIPACMSHLPVYQGLPVPYVAIWTSERVGPMLDWTPKGVKARRNPQFLRFYDNVWWLDTPDNRGQGEPIFGGTHSTRQRNCMRDGICQVCGKKQNPKNLLWVVPHAEDQVILHDEYNMILNPPTCEACFRGALRICPHLIQLGQYARVYRGTPHITGVHGTLVKPGNAADIVYIRLDDEGMEGVLPFVMGRQHMVSLTNEVEVDVAQFMR